MDPHGLLHSAQIARRQGRLFEAQRDLTQAVAHFRDHGPTLDLINALKALGQVERDGGDYLVSVMRYEEAAALARTHADPLTLAHTLRHIGDIHRDVGKVDLAAPFYEESVALYRAHQPTALDLANALRPFALLKQALGESEVARALFVEARELYIDAGVYAGADECARLAGLVS